MDALRRFLELFSVERGSDLGDTLGGVTLEGLDQFHQDGWVAVGEILDNAEVDFNLITGFCHAISTDTAAVRVCPGTTLR